jgi:hypothetical protein
LKCLFHAAFQEHWFKEVGETLSGKGQFPDLEQAGNLRAQVIASFRFTHKYELGA